MYTAQDSIKTQGVGSREQWVAELQKRGADLPEQIVDDYIYYGDLIGYNYDLALAQAILECAGFTDYKWIQFRNPAGLGSTDRSITGDVFSSVEAGITGQYSHQCAYAESPSSCPIEQMDPVAYGMLFNDSRHQLVGHQNSPQIRAWNGHWAVPGTTYAEEIAAIANTVIGDTPVQPPPVPPPPVWKPNIVDLTGRLFRNPNGGPNYQNPAKVGIVWHYNGPPPNPNAETQYINDAVYHANKDWGSGNFGDGIMYHWGIGWDGTIYKLRDEDDVLWHCGAWVPGGNDTGIAINTNIGEGQIASPEQIRSAAWLGNDIRSRRPEVHLGLCKGHQELSPTACPGTLMDDLVIPYRDGQLGGVMPPTTTDGFLHENGHTIGGGFEHIISMLDAASHQMRMKLVGYAISEEGDGYLMVPETRDDGSTTGRFHPKPVVVQKFERQTLIHEADEPNPDWQDVVPLTNRGFFAGFPDDPAIDAILKNPNAQY